MKWSFSCGSFLGGKIHLGKCFCSPKALILRKKKKKKAVNGGKSWPEMKCSIWSALVRHEGRQLEPCRDELLSSICVLHVWEELNTCNSCCCQWASAWRGKILAKKYLHVPLELTCMLNFKIQALIKRSLKGCQPQTKHFPSIWPWLLMSRMVNISLGLFILLPFCNLSCIHSRDVKAIFSDVVFHW